MCGIAGFVTTRPASGSEATLARMTDAIRHRGPDDSGFYHDEWAHLGHRRLSIIDVAGGHQPMANETRTLWITYNGEIFNHADLRPALEQAGHRYTSRSDTETILHAYEQHGPDSLAAFPRDVRFRHLGPPAPPAFLRARPPGHQAVLLFLGRPPVRLRLRDQGAARTSCHFAGA